MEKKSLVKSNSTVIIFNKLLNAVERIGEFLSQDNYICQFQKQ